jgi:predicted PurR-regulated permease PerM
MPILTFFLLANWPSTVKMLRRLIPHSWRADVFKVTKDMDLMLAQFVRGQLLVMLILAVYYAVGLKLTGLDVAISVGVLTGLFVMIPFLGFGLGLVLACLSALLQFGFSPPFFAVLAIYAVGQAIESYVLTPRLVGERIGLSPVAVIFSLMVFGALFGLFGVLFALPAAAMVAVLVRYGRSKYFTSAFYSHSSSARS